MHADCIFGGLYIRTGPEQVFKAALAAVEALTQLRHPSEQMSELLRPVLESLPSLTQHLSCVSCHVAVQVANALASLLQSPLPSADYKCAPARGTSLARASGFVCQDWRDDNCTGQLLPSECGAREVVVAQLIPARSAACPRFVIRAVSVCQCWHLL